MGGLPEAIGGAILSALVKIKAALIIGAAALTELSFGAAEESVKMHEPLTTFFVRLSMILGGAAALAAVMYIIDQGWQLIHSIKNRPRSARRRT